MLGIRTFLPPSLGSLIMLPVVSTRAHRERFDITLFWGQGQCPELVHSLDPFALFWLVSEVHLTESGLT
jgi:hypothetical protein